MLKKKYMTNALLFRYLCIHIRTRTLKNIRYVSDRNIQNSRLWSARLTLSGPRFFRYRKDLRFFWKLVGRILYMHICYHKVFLTKFSVLRVLGLKKASKFDPSQKFQKPKPLFLNIFQKFLQK